MVEKTIILWPISGSILGQLGAGIGNYMRVKSEKGTSSFHIDTIYQFDEEKKGKRSLVESCWKLKREIIKNVDFKSNIEKLNARLKKSQGLIPLHLRAKWYPVHPSHGCVLTAMFATQKTITLAFWQP